MKDPLRYLAGLVLLMSSGGSLPTEQVVTFTAPAAVYQLPTVPSIDARRPLVWLNGLLEAPGADYALDGAVLTFVGESAAAAAAPGSIVQVDYWSN